jgi:hypothetical protein
LVIDSNLDFSFVGFDPTASHCGGVYPADKNGLNATCFKHNWEENSARHHLWASSMLPGRKITRIFLADVLSRIKNGGLTPSGVCDAALQTTLKQAHKRGIRVYAEFASSDAAFSEQTMANYPNEFNTACGDDEIYFDGVAVNNEYFSQVRSCSDQSKIALQDQFLIDLNTTTYNALPLPLHFSVSWNWDCCDCDPNNYITRELTWDGEKKSALQHMINIVDSVDVQVAYNTPSAMTTRAIKPYEYWLDKRASGKATPSTALYVLAYTNPNYLCQLSFSPHKEGSSRVKDECSFGGERTEVAMYDAFDTVEGALPGSKGGIHLMSGVYSSGITADWPVHNATTCPLDKRYNSKKKKCVRKCRSRRGEIWQPDSCGCGCPSPCRVWRKGKRKCTTRCGRKWKWDADANTCIRKVSSKLGYVWDKEEKICKLV